MRRSKYGNKKIVIDGHKFDSKAEARYYQELIYRKKAGDIKDFSLQPRFELQPKYKKANKSIRKIEYISDFEIEYADGSIEIVDVKGAITKEFALKRKLFDYHYDLKLSVLKFDRARGWIEV
ncbi:DUF1064 domain-containing protein [Aquibacillus rhizosphaerae]|uniref:DUF1064 domain-containing protein n=1 Tax=Aquibacillus rhizosphaerae TaxID=3051431 RepID=A0ABT7LAC1_9BACI|nr:DUF1064 domain-containing protein [Aquibacillus sp. LR5S19]MDL4842814.1 DUF1064 domain-containing protein [Aquibacillus sp. LR5S19]